MHAHTRTLSLSFPPSQLISIHDAFLSSCSLVFALAQTVSHRNRESEKGREGKGGMEWRDIRRREEGGEIKTQRHGECV